MFKWLSQYNLVLNEVGDEVRKEGFYHCDTDKGRRKRELMTSG